MELIVHADGSLHCLYDETLDLSQIGPVSIRRASHVEPTHQGQWQADLSPVDGPILGPCALRSDALTAEVEWLQTNWLVPDAPEWTIGRGSPRATLTVTWAPHHVGPFCLVYFVL